MKILNVAIIGTGFGALVHLPSYKIHPMYRVVGIYGRNKEKTKRIAEQYSIKAYGSKAEIAEDHEVDLVSISSIVKDHLEDVKLFYGNKKYILLEKPMALTYEEACQIEELSKAGNTYTAVCHEHKYDSSWQYVKALISNKTYGNLRSIYFDYRFTYWNSLNSTRKYDWFSQKESGGGMIGGHLSHVLDLIQFIDTSGVKKIQGEGMVEVPYHLDKDGRKRMQTAEDTVQATVTMQSGTYVYINLSAARFEMKKTVCIYTEQAKILIEGQKQIHIYDINGNLITKKIPDEFCLRDYGDDLRLNSFVRLLEDLYQCYVNDKSSDITDFEKGLITQKMLDSVKLGGMGNV